MSHAQSKNILEFSRSTRMAPTRFGVYKLIEVIPTGRKSKLYQATLTATGAESVTIWESLLYSVVADARDDAREHFASQMKALDAPPDVPPTQPELPLKADDAPVEVPVEELPAVAPEELPELTIENAEPALVKNEHLQPLRMPSLSLDILTQTLVRTEMVLAELKQQNRPCRRCRPVVLFDIHNPTVVKFLWGPIIAEGKGFQEAEDEFDRQYLASDFNSVRVP